MARVLDLMKLRNYTMGLTLLKFMVYPTTYF